MIHVSRRLGVAAVAVAVLSAAAAAAAQGPPADAACATDLDRVNHMSGWQAGWLRRWDGLAPDGEAADAAEALRDAVAELDDREARLRADLDGPQTAPRAVVVRVLAQLDAVLARRDAAGRPAADVETLDRVRGHRRFLADEYLPRTRATSPLAGSPDPEACFLAAAANWMALDVDVAAVEAAGWRLLDEFGREFVARSGPGEATLAARLTALRDAAPAPLSGEELTALSASAVARATDAAAEFVPDGPLAPVRVEAMDAAAAATFPAGFYRRDADGDGVYVINTSRAPERRLMAEAIAFHETVPGHHLQSQRAHGRGRFDAGFAEGWATYAEYLADEAGLYSADVDRLGATAKRLWSASRLVVEPGLHVRGWSRDEAVDFMLAHTALPQAEIEIEVDRYLAWPGQSLSYSLGFDRLRGLRAEAEAALGDGFDLRAFHAVVLDPGPRPLARVADDVDAWIAAERP